MRKIASVIWVLIIYAFLLASCGVDDIDISGYEKESIILKGLSDQDENVTVSDLKAIKCVTEETQSTSDKIGTVRATGPLLSTLVESYGLSLTDFSEVIIYGEDEYEIKLDRDFLKESRIILAFGIDGEALTEDSRPVRVIIPESDSAYWVRMVSKVEFIR